MADFAFEHSFKIVLGDSLVCPPLKRAISPCLFTAEFTCSYRCLQPGSFGFLYCGLELNSVAASLLSRSLRLSFRIMLCPFLLRHCQALLRVFMSDET